VGQRKTKGGQKKSRRHARGKNHGRCKKTEERKDRKGRVPPGSTTMRKATIVPRKKEQRSKKGFRRKVGGPRSLPGDSKSKIASNSGTSRKQEGAKRKKKPIYPLQIHQDQGETKLGKKKGQYHNKNWEKAKMKGKNSPQGRPARGGWTGGKRSI